MDAITHTFKDGDIFHWRYNDEKPEDRGAYRRYHCKSQIAVVRDGRLVDTYWSSNTDTSWSFERAAQDLDLTFVANFSELTKSYEGMREFYDDADCVNLNHSNSSRDNFYIRTGAKRSAKKMEEVAQYKRDKAIQTMLSAASDVARLDSVLHGIRHGGADLDKVWL